nr:TolC family protein [Pigmentibacter ruber]
MNFEKQGKKIFYSLLAFCKMIPAISIELESYLTKPSNNFIELTLEKCINLGLQNSINIIRDKNTLELTGYDILKSYGNFLPNLALQIGNNYTYGNNYLTTTTPTYVNTSGFFGNLSISSTLNLFNGFADISALNTFLAKKDSDKFSLERAKQIIAIDIIQNYLQITLDSNMIEIAAQNLQEYQTREKLLLAQTNLGAKSIADLYLQQAQTSLAESNLNTLKNKMRNDEIFLLKKIRLDYQKNYKFIPVKFQDVLQDTNQISEISLISIALSKRSDLKSLQALKNVAALGIENAKSTYYPKIDFTVTAASNAAYVNNQVVNGNNISYSSQDQYPNQFLSNIKYQFLINLNWTIFDKLATYGNENQAKIKYLQTKIDENDEQQKIISEVRSEYGNYKLAIQDLESSARVLLASKKAYQVMSGRYKVGSASFIDLITSQSALEQAEYNRSKSLINFLMQKWNLKYVTGELQN